MSIGWEGTQFHNTLPFIVLTIITAIINKFLIEITYIEYNIKQLKKAVDHFHLQGVMTVTYFLA